MLGVAVLNTINTHKFRPSVIPGSKFKIRSQYFAITSLAFLNLYQLYVFAACLHSTIHCKFYTLTSQSLLLWHKYLESLGKNNVFTHVFFAVCHGGGTHKRTIAQQSRRSSKLCESSCTIPLCYNCIVHCINSSELHLQGVALRSQYSDPVPEVVMPQ